MSYKIAYVGQRGVPPTFGGVERYVDEIVNRLPADEVASTVYCRRHYVEPQDLPYTRQLFVPSMQMKGLEAFSHSGFSALDCIREPYDLVHFQALGPAIFSALPKVRGAKIVTTVHGLDWDRAKWGNSARMILKAGDWMMGHASDAIISVSRNLQRYYQDKYNKEVFYVPIGFSAPQRVPLNSLHAKYGLEPHKYMLFLNRLVPEKGVHYAIEAFKQVARDDMKFVIAGSSEQGDRYRADLEQMAKDDPRIIFTGYVTREEVHELYSNAFLFLLPSELEGMPAVLMEAMSHGCPVLISDIQESVDVIDSGDGYVGFVHRNKDVDDLLRCMRELTEDPDQVDKLRAPGCQFVHQRYSWDKAVEATYDVYKHVLNG